MLGDYRSIAAEKRLQRSNKIPKEWLIAPETFHEATNVLKVPFTCGVLTDVEYRITSDHDATAVLEKLKAGIWSAEQVTVAFCKRAAISQQLVNCLTEIFFDEAIERAQQLDRERAKNPGKALPPLWGLPISLKDSFDVLGHDTSTGLACYVNEPAKENSAIAALLLDLGAVLYCKTNLPQSIMTADSDNNVFGRTLNPQNIALTAGGSTGGEGALIALRGSILGVGTDIGGSIRVPSACNGIYGFRPSVGLVPHDGVRDLTVPGTDGVRSSAGPMATSFRDCSLFLKAILEADAWRYDSTTISLPWRNLPVKQKLRIGLVQDDGMYTPSPPVRRGLKRAADLLRQSNQVEIVPLMLPNAKEHYHDLLVYWSLSGSDYYIEQFARTGEPEVPSLKAIHLLSFPGTTLQGYFDLNVRRAAAAKQYLRIFLSSRIDAIMMPPAPHTAVPLDTWTTASYTGLFNFLDFPAVVIPVDEVRDHDVADNLTNAKYGPDDAAVYSLYTGPELYKGASVCVQVVGYRHSDEALINVIGVLDPIIGRKDLQKR
ncbi:amidase [Amniculicola lignicola CBS 123094]|uniref:Amidase n=1 Tax=Amniculicola lignicola CBS 123094 TaxID=1392246 RepID=A0A6A5W293_9PLEO|nr:amidase [Amniculicola lignicola CBS 123094]